MMTRHRIEAIAAGTVLALVLSFSALSASPHGQATSASPRDQSASAPSASPREQKPTFRSQANYVLVDVRVWDGDKPVTDLTQQDFHLTEDGVPQTITGFTIEHVEQLATAGEGGAAPATIDLSRLPPSESTATILRNHRLTVLFFDLTSMPVDDLLRALQGAQHFVTAQMTPADLVAIATYSSTLRVLEDFTNNRTALTAALNGIQTGQSSALSEAGTEGDTGDTNASGETVVNQDVSAAFTPDESEFNLFNTDEKLMAIESLARMLRDVPGRKSIIHFSSGLTRTGQENEAQLRAATDAANLADASLYTFDARGLVALPPGGDASTAAPGGTSLYSGQAFRSQLSSLHDSRETLTALAADTGGRSFTDVNDFSRAFADVQRENSTYYLLTYASTNTASDGKFRRIRVTVDRHGTRVQARPGYFAPKSFRQFTKGDKDLQLAQALALDTPFVDLPLAVEPSAFETSPGHYQVVLAAKIPGSAVPFAGKATTKKTEFDFAWRATDKNGAVVAALRDTLPVQLNEAQYQQVSKGSLVYRGGIELPAGAFTLKVAVRENESGRIGTFEQPLDLPADPPPLALSSIVLGNELQAAPEQNGRRGERGGFGGFRGFGGPGGFTPPGADRVDPLAVGPSQIIVPSVTRVFRVGQTLFVRFESYARSAASTVSTANPQAAGAPPQAAVVFFRGGVKISEAGPVPGRLDGSTGRASYLLRIPLARFPAGRYTLQVNVMDPAVGRVAFSRVPLVILPAF
ncbi:MAG TPA: VWA domain-containing protein [Vicinamibacterales bacterium]|jgi:VWFA-related protein